METPTAAQLPSRSLWPLTVRGWLFLVLSVAVGLCFWKLERDWYSGGLAAASLWIVLGLTAQSHDLWTSFKGNGALTREERWGWRFAFAWRLALACLIGVYFLVRVLVLGNVVALDDGPDLILLSGSEMWAAVLFTSMIVAIGSSPRLVRRGHRRSWSWAVGLLAGIAATVLCMILLMEQLLISVLVHVTIAGIQAAQPLWLSTKTLATHDPAIIARLFGVTTVGIVTIVVSFSLVRLLSLAWWQGWRQRVILSVLLAASLTVMVLLADKVVRVEVPRATPILAASISVPRPHRLVAGALLALLLVTVVAGRWSESPSTVSVASGSWRRDQGRYYHERGALVILLAGALLASLFAALGFSMDTLWYLASWIADPSACLSVALIFLGVQSVFSGRSECSDAASASRPRLAPGLFLLIWIAFCTIIVCGVPILGAWGFALGFGLG